MADAPNIDGLCSCGNAMSTNFYNKHSLCSSCIGHECNLERRCNECQSWSDEHMTHYLQNLESENSVTLDKETRTVDDTSPNNREPDAPSQSELSEFKDQMEERFNQVMSGISALIDSKLDQNARNNSLSLRPNSPNSRSASHDLEQRELRPGGSSSTAHPGVSLVNPSRNNVELDIFPINANKEGKVKNKSKGQINPCQGKATSNQVGRVKGKSKQMAKRNETTVSGKSHPTKLGHNLSHRNDYENRKKNKSHSNQRIHNYEDEIEVENEEDCDD